MGRGGVILNVIFTTNKIEKRMNPSDLGWGPVRFVNTAVNLEDSVRREELTQTWRLLFPQGQVCSIQLV